MIETKFKHTDIGTIPHDWEIYTVDEVASLYGRIGFRGYTVQDLVPEGQGAITLSPTNIKSGVMNYDKCSYISWEKYEESPEIMVQDGDILMVKTGSTFGKSALVENLPCEATINPQFVVFKKIKCQNKLLALQIAQSYFQNQIASITSGGAIPTMSQAKILKCKVALPPTIGEQVRIAEALSDIDTLIQDLKKLIEKKQYIQRATMQQLLSANIRLKGFTEKWKETIVFVVTGKIKRGQTLTSDNFVNGNVPVVAGGKQYAGYHNVANQEGRTITISGSGASAGYVAIHNIPIFATDCSVIAEKDNFSLDYLYYLLSFRQDDLYKLQTGGAQPHVYPHDIEKISILIPPTLAEQQAIAKVLTDMDEEIQSLKQRLQKYQDLRSGMMQQLLTGKIRLL